MNHPFQIKIIKGKENIWDVFRKKYVQLSPEEWVRQNVLWVLVHKRNYPKASISVEKQLRVGGVAKRYDTLVYKKEKPWLLIEFKQETVSINEASLQQILGYKSVLPVHYLVITNGKEVHSYNVHQQLWLDDFPDYEEYEEVI